MAWYWPFPFPPSLDWLQVEISSSCNAACRYCPRTIYRDRWLDRRMEMEMFRLLLPTLKKTELVYLQGWGEPFTHPDFYQFVQIAKAAGCQVGTTTNGMLLDQDHCHRLVAEQIDILGFSLSGTGANNDLVRQGTQMAKVLAVINTLHRTKQRTGAKRPALHIAYLLLRSGLPDLHRLVDLLKDRGIAQVVISTLDFVSCPTLIEESIIPQSGEEHRDLCQQLEAVATAGLAAGLPIHFRLPRPDALRTTSRSHLQDGATEDAIARRSCTEHVHRAAFIGVDGAVSPCVFTQLPVRPGTRYMVGQVERPYQPTVFGRLQDQSFAALWRSEAYAKFRQAHRSGSPPPPPVNTAPR